VRVPKKENVQLYSTAAAAAAAGFRPCLRCRPESSPGTPAWIGSSWKVGRALQLIDQGYLDEAGVNELAAELGVGPRQLARLFRNHLGASPLEVAQTRRLHFAKKLIDETRLPLSEVCFAAGFGSLRRFNAVFQDVYGRSPRQLRNGPRWRVKGDSDRIHLQLSYRPPFDWRALLGFLAFRAIPGVEVVTPTSYARSFRLDDCCGDFELHFADSEPTVQVSIALADSRLLFQVVDRIRALLDLRADSDFIDANFASDELLGPVAKACPGTRVPGCWDGLEVAVRAILGQQVTVRAATTLVSRLVARHGQPCASSLDGIDFVFPETATLARADLTGLGIVGQRIAAITELAQRLSEDKIRIDCHTPTDEFVRKLCEIKGIGEWTAQYVAMRSLNDPDAFPHGDLILRRAAAEPGVTLTPGQLLRRAEVWRPWRAYSVLLLWRYYADRAKSQARAATAKETEA